MNESGGRWTHSPSEKWNGPLLRVEKVTLDLDLGYNIQISLSKTKDHFIVVSFDKKIFYSHKTNTNMKSSFVACVLLALLAPHSCRSDALTSRFNVLVSIGRKGHSWVFVVVVSLVGVHVTSSSPLCVLDGTAEDRSENVSFSLLLLFV